MQVQQVVEDRYASRDSRGYALWVGVTLGFGVGAMTLADLFQALGEQMDVMDCQGYPGCGCAGSDR